MKTILRQITGIMLLAFFISLPEVILAQKEAVDYITVSGVVKDNSTE
ncbi:MAG: hypothetical protein PHT63_04905 [Bacteroidales bacterium]|nr:hypothetical protein [Bacteroidales bacterium]